MFVLQVENTFQIFMLTVLKDWVNFKPEDWQSLLQQHVSLPAARMEFLLIILLFCNFGGHQSFLWGHWFGLLMISVLVFKARGGPLACILPCLCAMDFLDSPLVWHLLTSWQPAWQPRLFWLTYLYMYSQVLVGLEPRFEFAAQCAFWPSEPFWLYYWIWLNWHFAWTKVMFVGIQIWMFGLLNSVVLLVHS